MLTVSSKWIDDSFFPGPGEKQVWYLASKIPFSDQGNKIFSELVLTLEFVNTF